MTPPVPGDSVHGARELGREGVRCAPAHGHRGLSGPMPGDVKPCSHVLCPRASPGRRLCLETLLLRLVPLFVYFSL